MSGGEEEEEAVLGQPVLTADEAQMKPRLALQSSSQNHRPLLVLSVQTLLQMEGGLFKPGLLACLKNLM